MTRRDDAPGALPAQRGTAHDLAHRDGLVGRDPGSEAGRVVRSDLPRQAMVDLVTAATMAPSMHNTQPWRFRIEPASQTIGLRADPARMLRFGDPAGRALHIACGAALFNLRLAAAMAGRQPVFRLLPDPGQPLLLATVRLAGWRQPQPDERELHEAITARHTNRSPYSGRPVPPGVLAELAEAARIEGAILHFPDHQEAIRLLGLARDAERALLSDPAYREELARWAGGARDREGIPDEVLAPHDPRGTAPVRDFTPAGPASYAWFEDEPQLAVLSTHFSGRADWLRAGQALQRVWLTATSRGLAVSPLTHPLETADAWLVRDPRSSVEDPQMILRLGYGLPVLRTHRRPIADVLDASM
jgi:nitroreductase